MSVETRLPHPHTQPKIINVGSEASSMLWSPTDEMPGLARLSRPLHCGYPIDENIENALRFLDPRPANKNVLHRALYQHVGIEGVTYRSDDATIISEVSVPSPQVIRQKLGRLGVGVASLKLLPGGQYNDLQFTESIADGTPPVASDEFWYAHDLFTHYLPGWVLTPPKSVQNQSAVARHILETGNAERRHNYTDFMDSEGPSDATYMVLSGLKPESVYSSAAASLNFVEQLYAPDLDLNPVTPEDVKAYHESLAVALGVGVLR